MKDPDLNDIFIENGVYKFKGSTDNSLFVCESLPGKRIGKIVVYDKVGTGFYNKTGTQYFLNDYKSGDLKGIFVTRENYDMIGIIGSNYVSSSKFLAANEVIEALEE